MRTDAIALAWLHSRDSYSNSTLGRPQSTQFCSACGERPTNAAGFCGPCAAARRPDQGSYTSVITMKGHPV